MKIYCHPRWTTCKKTIRLIEELKIKYDYVDLTETSIEYEELLDIYNNNDYKLKQYFNTSGMEYRKNNIKDQFDKLTAEEMLKLISENGLLLKRPFIIDDEILIGNNLELLAMKYSK